MPYLNDIPTQKCDSCRSVAKTQLFNDRGGSMGYFCRPCGKRKLKREQAEADKRVIIVSVTDS